MKYTFCILSLFIISCLNLSASAENYNYRDGTFVISFKKNVPNEDTKCDLFIDNSTSLKVRVDSIMKSGRYVESVISTKFGELVLSRNNDNSSPQFFDIIKSYDLKKEAKNRFKEGYSVLYFNYEKGYIIYDKNPNIIKQDVKESMSDKDIRKYNEKGYYIKTVGGNYFTLQEINGVKSNQKYLRKYIYKEPDSVLYKIISQFYNDGYVISSACKSHNESGDFNFYKIIFDKVELDGNGIADDVFLVDSLEDFKELLSVYYESGYSINNFWGGWRNIDYAKRARDIAEFDRTHSFGAILGGLISSGTSLINQINNNSNNSSNQSYNSNSTVESSPTNKSRKWVSCSTCNGTGVCRNCGGSGNYSYTKDGKCHECRPVGSGKCGTCKGKKGSYVQ